MLRLGTTGRDALLDALFSDFAGFPQTSRSVPTRRELPVNLYETEAFYLLETEVPGVKESEVELSVKGDEVTLTIRPEKEELAEGVTVHRMERTRQPRTRVFRFATEIESNEVEALLRDGVLTVRLPKHASQRPKKIQVVTH